MALLRRVGTPNRFRVLGIDKSLQRGAQLEFLYQKFEQILQHSWVEAFVDGQWIALEGVILDDLYLNSVRETFSGHCGAFNGFAIAVDDFQNFDVRWSGTDTFVQSAAIVEDRGTFDSPDDFYLGKATNLRGWRGVVWRLLFQKRANEQIEAIRQGELPENAKQVLGHLPVSIFNTSRNHMCSPHKELKTTIK